MLNAVIVVLRETLEASFLISLTLLYSDLLKISRNWLPLALVLASLVAYMVAENMHIISEWFDGVGQEILFSIMLLMVACSIILLNLIAYIKIHFYQKVPTKNVTISLLMIFCIISTTSLEGAEIIIYFESSKQQTGALFSTTIGSLLGAGIGFSIAVVFFYSIRVFRQERFLVIFILLSLVAAGMLIQSVGYLSQAGLIDTGLPLWDSSKLLDENSIIGQLLYALFGYESTPNLVQVTVYFASILVPLLLLVTITKYRKKT